MLVTMTTNAFSTSEALLLWLFIMSFSSVGGEGSAELERFLKEESVNEGSGSLPTPTCNVHRDVICDGHYDCADQSDETGCNCPSYMFKCDCYETSCLSKWGCLSPSKLCNEQDDCGDMSDERNCQCSDRRFQCRNSDCIDRSKVNDGNKDCSNEDDEFVCNMTQGHVNCNYMNDCIRCTSFGRCIPDYWIGDTIPDCENHNDEPCNATKVWCEDCWVIINQCSTDRNRDLLLRSSRHDKAKCRSVTMPTDKQKTFETHWICTTSPCSRCLYTFQCENGQFIDNKHYCDAKLHCKDNSDEDTTHFGFRCSGKITKTDCVLPQRNIYDSVAQCEDSSDLCFVNSEFRCFSCLDGKFIISAKQVCDGIVGCYDISDECLCANQSVCNAVRGKEIPRCPSNQISCYNDTDCVDMDKVLCNSSVNCIDGKNQRFCHQDLLSSRRIRCNAWSQINGIIAVFAARCDGRPECREMEDECDECEPRPLFCDGRCAMEARKFAAGTRVCDGMVNYVGTMQCDQEVEENCTMRFYCKSEGKMSIDKRFLCDGIFDCDNHSDENKTSCHNKRFYCAKGNMTSIDKSCVCNGMEDCDNGEDEAGELCGSDNSLFSDQYEMIASPILRALFWIMGLLALGGNVIINFRSAKKVISYKNNNAAKLANDVFILNLTLSDFLMGVYLIAVAAQGRKYSGYYGLVDKEWRSSNICSGFGMLAFLSSETSVLIMTSMSSFRLITIYKPFLFTSIKIKWIYVTVCFCWIFSFLIATIPWIPFDSGYFISDVWFHSVCLKTETVSKSDMFTLAKQVSGDNSVFTTWFTVKEIVSEAFKYNRIKGEFGYYSETSVCMPRFYASNNEGAWQYSIVVLTLNFIMFIYMVVAYVLVYKNVGSERESVPAKINPKKGMQKRISRLLLTDFFCWFPVCIMGYLSAAGISLPDNAYIVSAGLLLPINSAMNPIVYSKYIGRQISHAKKLIIQKLLCISSCRADEADDPETCYNRSEDVTKRVTEI